MQTIEQHADQLDTASDIQQAEIDIAIQKIRNNQTKEKPVFNSNGLRICLDCDDSILPERIAANPHAVRCVHCQEEHEQFNKFHGYRYV